MPPATRIATERERLRELSIPASEYALRFSVVVGPTGLVSFQGYRYSMPPEAIGIPGMLWLYRERIRIVAGRFAREHARVPEQGKDSIHPEDRSRRLAAAAGSRVISRVPKWVQAGYVSVALITAYLAWVGLQYPPTDQTIWFRLVLVLVALVLGALWPVTLAVVLWNVLRVSTNP